MKIASRLQLSRMIYSHTTALQLYHFFLLFVFHFSFILFVVFVALGLNLLGVYELIISVAKFLPLALGDLVL